MRPAYAHIQATTSLNVRVWQMHGRHKSQNTVAPAPHWRSVFPEYNNITAATNRKEDTQVSNLFQNVEQELGVGKCGWNNFAMRCVFFTLIFVFSSLHISCVSRFWWPEHQPSDVNWSTFICHIYGWIWIMSMITLLALAMPSICHYSCAMTTVIQPNAWTVTYPINI